MVLWPYGFLKAWTAKSNALGNEKKTILRESIFDLWNASKSEVANVGLTHSQFAEMLLLKNVTKSDHLHPAVKITKQESCWNRVLICHYSMGLRLF